MALTDMSMPKTERPSVAAVQQSTGLARPFTAGSFQKRLEEFAQFIRDVTLQDVEATAEERREMITGKTRIRHFYWNGVGGPLFLHTKDNKITKISWYFLFSALEFFFNNTKF